MYIKRRPLQCTPFSAWCCTVYALEERGGRHKNHAACKSYKQLITRPARPKAHRQQEPPPPPLPHHNVSLVTTQQEFTFAVSYAMIGGINYTSGKNNSKHKHPVAVQSLLILSEKRVALKINASLGLHATASALRGPLTESSSRHKGTL